MMPAKWIVEIRQLENFRAMIAICVPLLGGALVIATSVLTRRGKAKGLLTGFFMLSASMGLACLFVALAGAFLAMPYSTIRLLLLLGIVLSAVMGIFTPEIIREYDRFEIRKLAAEVFRRS